ncbi:MAG TPA: transposase [Spirochaetota bacterium]|nr:transposase [Spirochaetota bacterium]
MNFKTGKKKFRFSLLNFVFVYTHCHFIISPKREKNLSKIMELLLGTFSVRYNKRLKIRGKVWFDRFKSEVIEKN